MRKLKKKKKNKAKSKQKTAAKKITEPIKFYGTHEVFSMVDNLSFENGDGEDQAATSELQIFPATKQVGDVYHPSQEEPLKLDEEFFQSCVASFNESGIDIMVDYNHASGMAMSEKDGAAAGFIVDLQARDDGLWGICEWNDRGLSSIESREYKYLSPEWSTHQYDKKSGEVVEQGRVFAVSLTNRPYLESLIAPVAASEQTEGLIMTEEENILVEPETGTEEAVEETTTAEADAVEEPTTADETAVETAGETDENLLATVRAEAALVALREVQAEQRNMLIELGMDEGKITPNMLTTVQKYSDALGQSGQADGGIKELKSFVASLPNQLFKHEVGTVEGQGDEEDTLSDTDRIMANRLGITTDLMKKFGEARTITQDGKLLLQDGSIIDL